MSRVINTATAGKDRNRLVKGLAIAIRELFSLAEIDDNSLDIAAFIVLSLEAIDKTIEPTVGPWEKRDYWVKADKFRIEWSWAGKYSGEMRKAVITEDWQKIGEVAIKIAERISKVKISPHHRMGTPWVGAWDELSSYESRANQ
jgi:hypothetical protein